HLLSFPLPLRAALPIYPRGSLPLGEYALDVRVDGSLVGQRVELHEQAHRSLRLNKMHHLRRDDTERARFQHLVVTPARHAVTQPDRKSTRLNSSHVKIS